MESDLGYLIMNNKVSGGGIGKSILRGGGVHAGPNESTKRKEAYEITGWRKEL